MKIVNNLTSNEMLFKDAEIGDAFVIKQTGCVYLKHRSNVAVCLDDGSVKFFLKDSVIEVVDAVLTVSAKETKK